MENLKDVVFVTHNEITIRDGRKLIVIGNKLLDGNGKYISNKKNYNSDLTNQIERYKEYDIMKVYNPITQELIFDRNAVDWTKVAVDTKVLVSADGIYWYKRHFAKYEDDGIYAFAFGRTSWSNQNSRLVDWNYAKLAENEVM